ncbi:MMS1_N domain-containing protein [Pycnococcus provasolii]
MHGDFHSGVGMRAKNALQTHAIPNDGRVAPIAHAANKHLLATQTLVRVRVDSDAPLGVTTTHVHIHNEAASLVAMAAVDDNAVVVVDDRGKVRVVDDDGQVVAVASATEKIVAPAVLVPCARPAVTSARQHGRKRVAVAALYDGLLHALSFDDSLSADVLPTHTSDVCGTGVETPPVVVDVVLLSGTSVDNALLVALLVEDQHEGTRSLHCACLDVGEDAASLRPGPWAVANVDPRTSLLHELHDRVNDHHSLVAVSRSGITMCPRYDTATDTTPQLGGTCEIVIAPPTCSLQTPSSTALVIGDASGMIHVVELIGGITDTSRWIMRTVDGTFSPPSAFLLLPTDDETMLVIASAGGDSQVILTTGDGDDSNKSDFLREWAFPGAEGGEEDKDANILASGECLLENIAPVRDVTPMRIASNIPQRASDALPAAPYEWHALACCGSGPSARLVRLHVGAAIVTDIVDGPNAAGVNKVFGCSEWLGFSWDDRTEVMQVSETGMSAMDLPGIDSSSATLAMAHLSQAAVLQITKDEIRLCGMQQHQHVVWKPPPSTCIIAAEASHEGCCALACDDGKLRTVRITDDSAALTATHDALHEAAALAVCKDAAAIGYWVTNEVHILPNEGVGGHPMTIALAPEQPRALHITSFNSGSINAYACTSGGSVLLSTLRWPLEGGTHVPSRRVCVGVTAPRLLLLDRAVLAYCDEGAALITQDDEEWRTTRVGGWPGTHLIAALGDDRFAWVEPRGWRLQVGRLDRSEQLRFTSHRIGAAGNEKRETPVFASFHSTSGCAVVVTSSSQHTAKQSYSVRLVQITDGGLGPFKDAHAIQLDAGHVPTCISTAFINGVEYVVLCTYASMDSVSHDDDAVQGLIGLFSVVVGETALPHLRLVGARPVPSVAFAARIVDGDNAQLSRVVLGTHDGVIVLDVSIDVDGTRMEAQLERELQAAAMAPSPAEENADGDVLHDALNMNLFGVATDVRGIVSLHPIPGTTPTSFVATKMFAPLAVVKVDESTVDVSHVEAPSDDATPLTAPYGVCMLPPRGDEELPPMAILTGHPRGVALVALDDDATVLRTLATSSPPDFLAHVVPHDVRLFVGGGDMKHRADALLIGSSGYATFVSTRPQ